MTALQMPAAHLAPSMLVPPGSGAWRRPRAFQLQQHSPSAAITIYEARICSKATCADNPTVQANQTLSQTFMSPALR